MGSRRVRAAAVFALFLLCLFARDVAAAGPQVELDRIVARVGGKIITQSDVRQSRTLLLVEETGTDDAATRCLVDRLLLLGEIARVQPGPGLTDAEVAEQRAVWERRLGGSGQVSTLLMETGMAESALQPWFRDDLRIQAYLDRQFGGLPEADRAKARADLLLRLRQRAGIK
jgi:hypothetical protein